tara:strand:+ start:4369 stop:4569 length:201 start_codon:yes stop_codon:yes gene_type:complete
MNRIKIKDNVGLERDITSHAVINTNKSAYENRLEQIRKTEEFNKEFSELKADMAEIKELLKNLGGK